MKNLFMLLAMSFISLLGALLATTGSVRLVGGFIGLLLGAFLIFSPILLFWVTLAVSLVFSGLAEFYANIGQANWIPFILAFALVVAAFLAKIKNSKNKPINSENSVSWIIAGYVVILLFSSLINGNSPVQLLVGVRNYIPFIGVFLATIFFNNSEQRLRHWVLAILIVALIQLPFALHQAIFVAPMRMQSLEAVGGGAEAIVGTFGGNQLGGGYTGEMAVFMLIASCIALSLVPLIRMGKLLAWFLTISAIVCVGMAETKIVFILAPIAIFLVFLEEIRSSPKKLFALLFGLTTVLGLLTAVYAWRFWSKGPDEFWHAFTYSFDPNFMVDKFHRGRIAALYHWWDNNIVQFELLHAIGGYGMASTLEASSILGQGTAVKLFGLGLDAHAASKLLWDSGLLGTCFFVWLITRSALNAHRLVTKYSVPAFHFAVLKASRSAMLCFVAMLPYQVSVIGAPPMQFLFWFFIGYIEYWRRSAVLKGKV